MNPNAVSSDEWEDCPKGTLQSVANRSRRQRTIKRAAWAIPLTLVMLLAWAGWLPSPFSSKSSALACDQVVKLLPDYASNSLSVTRRAQVEQHLKKCPFCAEKLRTIQATQSVVENSTVGLSCTRSDDSVRYARRPTDSASREISFRITVCRCPLIKPSVFNLPIRIVTVSRVVPIRFAIS